MQVAAELEEMWKESHRRTMEVFDGIQRTTDVDAHADGDHGTSVLRPETADSWDGPQKVRLGSG